MTTGEERTNAVPEKQEPAPRRPTFHLNPIRLASQWLKACAPNAPIRSIYSSARPDYALILGLAAEGGGVSLYGKPDDDGHWTFWSDMNDWTPTLIDESAIHRITNDAASWNAAIAVLDEHFPYWTSLNLRHVHPDFRTPMLELIESRQAVNHLVHRTGAQR